MIFHKLLIQTIWKITSHNCLANLGNIIERNCHTICRGMELKEVVGCLERYAPLSLAEDWDNVGLLVEPSTRQLIKTIFLTNDLTENVMEEAVKKNANMIISYHPPIFTPFKSLTQSSWKQRIIVKAIENKIAIYSPHTTFDSVNGGINDWLASGLGEGNVLPLKNTLSKERGANRVTIFIPKDKTTTFTDQLVAKIRETGDVVHTEVKEHGTDRYLNVDCGGNSLFNVVKVLTDESPELLLRTNVFKMAKMPIKDTGVGRLCTLYERVSVETIIQRIKVHLKLKNVRFASGNPELVPSQSLVKTIALCAGSGASVLKGVKADMYLTGEMSHHEILDAVSQGIHVVLCEHSNTERGFFIDKFRDVLHDMLESRVEVLVSAEDADPVAII